MPPKAPDFGSRAQLTELMDEPCSRDEMRACLRDLARLNQWFRGYRPVLWWLDSLGLNEAAGPVRLLDVACGGGDGLRRVAQWAQERNVAAELVGLDVNADAVAIAAEAGLAARPIEWVCGDVFGYKPARQFDLVMSSLFTHHLSDADVVRFLQWMEKNAARSWFVNDLSRAAVPYYLLKAFGKAAGLHHFVQHDGPVSIARAFVREDWERLSAEAGLKADEFAIREFTPARLCVMRAKKR